MFAFGDICVEMRIMQKTMYMKTLYLPPESEIIFLLSDSFVCQSGMDEGNGAIDPVSPLDLSGDVWDVIL